MNPFEWHWLAKTLVSLALVIPAWLSIDFFKNNYGVKGETTLVWYFLGTVLGTVFLILLFGPAGTPTLFPSPVITFAIVAVGVLFGALANALLFSAMPFAPNSGLPIAIQGSSVAFVFLSSWLLGIFVPRYFRSVTGDIYQLGGILLVILGVAIIILRAK